MSSSKSTEDKLNRVIDELKVKCEQLSVVVKEEQFNMKETKF